jgi:hypothetical protein
MPFSVHTFETNPEGNLGFAFHENVGEGQELYFLAKFTSETTNAQDTAESIFGAIVDHFKKPSNKEAYDRFEDALKMANLEFQKAQGLTAQKPDIVVAFFDFHHLYLTQSGQSEAYLLREGQVSQITEIPEDSDDLFLNILSGQVSIDDVILLSSDRVLRTLTANQLSETFARPNFGEATNIFKHELSQKSEQDLLITLIGVGKKEATPAAGFLSKVMTAAKPGSTIAAENSDDTETPAAPMPEAATETATAPVAKPVATTATTRPSSPDPLAPAGPGLLSNLLDKVRGFRPNKSAVILAGVIFLLFSVVMGLNSINWESEEEVFLREQLDIAREALQQADTYLVQGEREIAKEQLGKANESVQEIFKSKSKLFRSDAQFLLADIKSKQLQVENAKQVSPNLVADLSIKNENFSAIGLLKLNETHFTFDTKNVVKNIRNIVEGGISITESGSVIAGTTRDDQNTLIFLTDSPRLIEYREGLIFPMETRDENWKSGIDIKNWGRNAYVLSPSENQIWKYERRLNNYDQAVAWNQDGNLAEAVSFAIDGSIYVLSADGTVQKLFRGLSQDYSFTDLPSVGFSGPNLKIYTTAELEFLYVLDPDNNRVLIFNKGDRTATYRRQVMYEIDPAIDASSAVDFVVDDSGQTVTIVTEDKVHEFSL